MRTRNSGVIVKNIKVCFQLFCSALFHAWHFKPTGQSKRQLQPAPLQQLEHLTWDQELE